MNRHLLEIHLAVLLFGLAGLFGKWLALPAVVIVLGRVVFAALALAAIAPLAGQRLYLRRRRDYFLLGLLGALLAVHWITFFHAIQLSTVAIGLLTFSTFPIFTVLLEPLMLRERRRAADLLLALITFAGVALVVPDFQLNNAFTLGAFWGTASGATFAVLSILNRRYVQQYPGLVIAFYQDAAAALVLLPLVWVLRPSLTVEQLLLLLLLGVVFTALSHTLFIQGLRTVPARTASIIATLEPVYGIAAAALLLGESPGGREIAGGLIILAATTYASLAGRRRTKPGTISGKENHLAGREGG